MLHLLQRDRAGLQSVRFASVLVRVRSFDRIASLIAYITENLQAEGSSDGQAEDRPVTPTCQTRTENDTRYRER
jgi:hypothetical protein